MPGHRGTEAQRLLSASVPLWRSYFISLAVQRPENQSPEHQHVQGALQQVHIKPFYIKTALTTTIFYLTIFDGHFFGMGFIRPSGRVCIRKQLGLFAANQCCTNRRER